MCKISSVLDPVALFEVQWWINDFYTVGIDYAVNLDAK